MIPRHIPCLARRQWDPGVRNPPKPKAEGDFGHQGLTARGLSMVYVAVSHNKPLDFDFVPSSLNFLQNSSGMVTLNPDRASISAHQVSRDGVDCTVYGYNRPVSCKQLGYLLNSHIINAALWLSSLKQTILCAHLVVWRVQYGFEYLNRTKQGQELSCQASSFPCFLATWVTSLARSFVRKNQTQS